MMNFILLAFLLTINVFYMDGTLELTKFQEYILLGVLILAVIAINVFDPPGKDDESE